MRSVVKVIQVGNSKGIRLGKRLLERYRIGETLVLEETPDAILLRPVTEEKLDWKATYEAMAGETEDWSDWEAVDAEGRTDED